MPAVDHPPFSTLLYRYFFFRWMFQPTDAFDDGNLFARAAARRHNRRQAAWLPVYIWRWLTVAIGLYFFGSFCNLDSNAPFAARIFYLGSACCASYAIAIAVTWLGLTRAVEQ